LLRFLCWLALLFSISVLHPQNTDRPVAFLENKGQLSDFKGRPSGELLFKLKDRCTDLYITDWGLSYVFFKPEKSPTPQIKGSSKLAYHYNRVDMILVGADIYRDNIVKEFESLDRKDFYLPQCQGGIVNVHAYQRLTIRNVYPGIDWVIYMDDFQNGQSPVGFVPGRAMTGQVVGGAKVEEIPGMLPNKQKSKVKSGEGIKYDFIIHPGADPSLIKLQYKYTDAPILQSDGSISVSTPLGEITEGKPMAYLPATNQKIDLDYTIRGNEIHFKTGHYDSHQTLVIDPALIWASYYGGASSDETKSISTDGTNVWVLGATNSMQFPVQNTATGNGYFQGTAIGGNDLFILEFNTCGSLIWSTYYGGTDEDYANSINSDGTNVWVTGYTLSTDFPTLSTGTAFKQSNIGGSGGSDAFVLQFSCLNNARIWATYLGGSGLDQGNSISSDGTNVWLTGTTSSANFPVKTPAGSFKQSTPGGPFAENAFVSQFSCASSTLIWSTYYGGSSQDIGTGISSDKKNVWVTGYTSSTDFPNATLSGAWKQPALGGTGATNGFVLEFSSTNSSRVWGSYLGGGGYDQANSISSDGRNVWITGFTNSTNFPIANLGGAYNQAAPGLSGTSTSFLSEFQCSGSNLQWSTYYGGTNVDAGYSIQSDGKSVWVSGATSSTDFPTMKSQCGFYQDTLGWNGNGQDIYISQFTTAGIPVWATYYGSDPENDGSYICSDGNNVFLAGDAQSNEYPTQTLAGAYNNGSPGGSGLGFENVVLAKFQASCASAGILNVVPDTSICSGTSVPLHAKGETSYSWTPSTGLSSTIIPNPVATPANTTTYTVTGSDACGGISTGTVQVIVNPSPDINITPPAAIICNSNTTVLTGNSITPGVLYHWSGGPNEKTDTVSLTGTYSLTITNPLTGCISSASVSVTNDNPVINVLQITNTCQGKTEGAIALANPKPGDTYSWSNGQLTNVISNLDSGKYSVTVTSTQGCEVSSTFYVTLFQNPIVNAGINKTINLGSTVQLQSTGGVSYSWSPSSSLNNPLINDPVADPTQNTKYSVTVTDVNKCSSIDSVFITVIDCNAGTIFVPTAFSPNFDGTNDILYMHAPDCIQQMNLTIYDRWGEQLFVSSDPDSGWDGSFNKKQMETGVYIYYLNATLSNGQHISRKGNITLLR